MKFVALVSGGKDSIYNIMECVVHNHELVALVNLCPSNCEDSETIEIDSFMYQSVGSESVELISEALGVPVFRMRIQGHSRCKRLLYHECHNDEVEDLYGILSRVLSEFPDITAVSSGAILSDYQRYRVENVAYRLGLRSLCFLWQRSQEELLEDIISARIEALIIKVASFGLTIGDFLGFRINDVATKLHQLSVPPWSLNVCGEGGEFETVTLDCPMYRSRIRLVSEPEVVVHSKDPFSPTAYLRLKNLVLEAKPLDEVYQTAEQLLSLERIHTNDQSSSCVSNRRPFISPFKRLEDIQLKTCEEIRGDIVCTVFPKRNSDDGGNNSKKHNHRGFDKTNLKSIKNVGRRLSNEIWITSNYSSTSESLHKIHEATENAFLQMKSVFASNGIRPQQILQIIAVLNQSLSSDVFNTFNKAYALQLDRWLREDVNNKTSREHEVVSSYMPTRVCICMNSISHEISVHSKEAFCVNLSAIIYYGNVDICGWIDSLRGLYVQSISHWAPANIGPYSQAIAVPLSFVQSDDCSSPSSTEYFTFYSGQIGLIPELEVLPSQNDHFMNSSEASAIESWLAIRHCHRLMKYMSISELWMNLFLGICYATNDDSMTLARNHFHLVVCVPALLNADSHEICYCSKCVVWLIVSGLPKDAVVEWQWITGPFTSLITTSSNTVVHDDPTIPSNTFMLFYQYDYYRLNKQKLSKLLGNYTGFVLPVVKFDNPSVNAVFVSVQNKYLSQ